MGAKSKNPHPQFANLVMGWNIFAREILWQRPKSCSSNLPNTTNWNCLHCR